MSLRGAGAGLHMAMLAALEADFREHGAATLADVRNKKPDAYLRLAAMLAVKASGSHPNPLGDLGDDDLELLLSLLSEAREARERGSSGTGTAP